MKPLFRSLLFFVLLQLVRAPSITAEPATADIPASLEEARGRARLLHRTIHATLQVVHRDFFRKDDKVPIPSQTLEDVFADLEKSKGVSLHWIAVTSKAMDVDHEPQDEFEERAVIALKAGREEFEAIEKNTYRYASTIRVHGSCIKCHVPTQHGDEKHNAGLVISMPFRNE